MVNSRDKFLDKFRQTGRSETDESMVKDVMTEEWRALCTEQTQMTAELHRENGMNVCKI